ncbi:acetyl-CoA hydrolase/transferase family protein [Sphingomonas profundi]|uniref:acetyl-CoA hydrolase/transferase family protein n=1 Tax=Alterirhizorhabdus profundi TaxID=2681549 RepID=UPI0012E7C11C|nr:acetyl-CoA hydrolase/transferase C-terminal domain-containing protein [Sphingomonas profundi]
MPQRIEPDGLAAVLPPGGLTLVSACSAESTVLADAVMAAGDALGPMTFSGIFVGGLNRQTWLANDRCRVLTFFLTPELRAVADRVEFLPLCYRDILAELRRRKPAAALFMCSPPDADGMCSFGTEVAFIADMWRDVPVRIAHINPLMPRTSGDPGIPFASLTAYIDAGQPLACLPAAPADATAAAIAGHVAPFVRDGATIQTGLGKIPDAVLRALVDRRALRIHTGLIGDGVLALMESGAISDPGAATVGVAIGSERLYAALGDPVFRFRPVSVTHGQDILSTIDDLVTINSAIEVDLFGQAYAELTPKGLMSGPGGASDFARGARNGGVRIVALPSDAANGQIARIVTPGRANGPVSLGRMDIDVVVTEHGAADLRALTYEARAQALIAIAPPAHRDRLHAEWADYSKRL